MVSVDIKRCRMNQSGTAMTHPGLRLSGALPRFLSVAWRQCLMQRWMSIGDELHEAKIPMTPLITPKPT